MYQKERRYLPSDLRPTFGSTCGETRSGWRTRNPGQQSNWSFWHPQGPGYPQCSPPVRPTLLEQFSPGMKVYATPLSIHPVQPTGGLDAVAVTPVEVELVTANEIYAPRKVTTSSTVTRSYLKESPWVLWKLDSLECMNGSAQTFVDSTSRDTVAFVRFRRNQRDPATAPPIRPLLFLFAIQQRCRDRIH